MSYTDVRESPAQQAERCSIKRARLMAASVVLFPAVSVLLRPQGGGAEATALNVLWLLYAAVVFLLIATGGGLLVERRVRRLMNDELTNSFRSAAFTGGFAASALCAFALAAVPPPASFTAQEGGHYILAIGLTVALLVWSGRELRAAQG